MSSKCNFSCWRPKTSRSKNTHLWGIQHSSAWSEIVQKGGGVSLNFFCKLLQFSWYLMIDCPTLHCVLGVVSSCTPTPLIVACLMCFWQLCLLPSLTLSGLVSVGAGGGWSQMMRRQLKIKFYQQLPVSIFLCIMVTLSQIQQLIYTPTLIWGIYSSAANRLIGEVVQSRRRPLLGPSPGWKRLLPLSHLRQY